MKYQEIKKHNSQARRVMMIVVLPVLAAVAFGPAVLTWLLHEKKHFLIAVLWMLFMGSVWIWQFIKTVTPAISAICCPQTPQAFTTTGA